MFKKCGAPNFCQRAKMHQKARKFSGGKFWKIKIPFLHLRIFLLSPLPVQSNKSTQAKHVILNDQVAATIGGVIQYSFGQPQTKCRRKSVAWYFTRLLRRTSYTTSTRGKIFPARTFNMLLLLSSSSSSFLFNGINKIQNEVRNKWLIYIIMKLTAFGC